MTKYLTGRSHATGMTNTHKYRSVKLISFIKTVLSCHETIQSDSANRLFNLKRTIYKHIADAGGHFFSHIIQYLCYIELSRTLRSNRKKLFSNHLYPLCAYDNINNHTTLEVYTSLLRKLSFTFVACLKFLLGNGYSRPFQG